MTSMKIRSAALLAVATGAVVAAGTASAHMPKTVTIRHQMRGCHSWSVSNGPWRTGLKLKVDRDTSLFFVNDDVMPHKLIQLSGAQASIVKPNMNHVGAHAYVTFKHAGVYRFTTKPGEDYMKGMKTIGEDNVLGLTVVVH
jgi:hypothetical protein